MKKRIAFDAPQHTGPQVDGLEFDGLEIGEAFVRLALRHPPRVPGQYPGVYWRDDDFTAAWADFMAAPAGTDPRDWWLDRAIADGLVSAGTVEDVPEDDPARTR